MASKVPEYEGYEILGLVRDYERRVQIEALPTVTVAIPDRPTEKPRAVVPAPEPDPLFALARRDTFAARVYFARLRGHERRRLLFGDAERVEQEAR